MEELLQPLVHGGRRPELEPGLAGQLRGRLLAKLAEPLGRAFEGRPGSGERVDEQAHGKADYDRLHTRLEQGYPRSGSQDDADEAGLEAKASRHEHGSEQGDGREERPDLERLGVDRRDHDEREDVVDDDDREHPRAVDDRGSAGRRARAGPSAKAVSVDIAIPHPAADERPALNAR